MLARIRGGRVLTHFKQRFDRFFEESPVYEYRSNSVGAILTCSHPVKQWKPPFRDEDCESWAFASDFPMDRALLSGKLTLCQLARSWVLAPDGRLISTAPPACFILQDKIRECWNVCNDGLGQAELYEYYDGRSWAVSNRISTFKTIGLPVTPINEEWAVYIALGGWFPGDLSGYRYVKKVVPGTCIRVDAEGVRKTSCDVLGSWLDPDRTIFDPVDEAHEGVRDFLKSVLTNTNDKVKIGVTAGYDSRLTLSLAMTFREKLKPYVKGGGQSIDSRVAHKICETLGLGLERDVVTDQISSSPSDWESSIRKAVRWQSGLMDSDKHKTMFANNSSFKAPEMLIMGQHGEIARGYYYASSQKILSSMSTSEVKDIFLRYWRRRIPSFFKDEVVNVIEEIIADRLDRAAEYKIRGRAILDFFYLNEDTRRKNASSLASTNNFIVTPLLIPQFISASFSLHSDKRAESFIHKEILRREGAVWLTIPFEMKRDRESYRHDEFDALEISRKFFNNSFRGSRYYDAWKEWSTVGCSLVERARLENAILNEITTGDIRYSEAMCCPDELAVLYAISSGS